MTSVMRSEKSWKSTNGLSGTNQELRSDNFLPRGCNPRIVLQWNAPSKGKCISAWDMRARSASRFGASSRWPRMCLSREYAERVATRLLEVLLDVEQYRETGRLYLP
jgi:hypothetical protein